MKFQIAIQLKANVFNAEEREVLSVLKSSLCDVETLKIAKLFTVEIPETSKNPQKEAEKIALNLTNSVIETFSIKEIND